MTTAKALPKDNHTVAGEILQSLATFGPAHNHARLHAIESVLNDNYQSRRVRKHSRLVGQSRSGDGPNSVLAAREVKVKPQELAILEYLSGIKRPATPDQIAKAVIYPLSSVSTRMAGLRDAGLIEVTGTGYPNGRPKAAYSITPEGRLRVPKSNSNA